LDCLPACLPALALALERAADYINVAFAARNNDIVVRRNRRRAS
jgi:hypothetical protein